MKKVITGFLAGALSMLIVWGAIREESAGFQPKVAVSLKGAQLSYGDLRKAATSELVPVENDEYSILETAAQNWIREQVLSAEMRALHVNSRDEVFQKQVWPKVHVTYEQVRSYYDKNREVYGATFDQVQPAISQELRRRAYIDAKEDYLKELIKKYEVKINLRKPGSYVEGLAVARQGTGPAAPGAPALQFMPPQAAGAAPMPAPVPSAPQPAANAVVNQDITGRPAKGPANAPVTIVQFSDFHCPFCQRVEATMDQIHQTYGDKVRIVWRNFPLPFHKGSDHTSAAAECAHEQGKFWEYHKELFANMSGDRSDAGLNAMAAKLGLDQVKFKQCLDSGRTNAIVQKDMTAGQQAGVNGTPASYVNGREVSGAVPFEQFKAVIDGILSGHPLPPPAPAAPAPTPANPGQPIVFSDLAGRPTMGNPNAKVTMVEFSDFHCPFCSRHAPTLEKLVKQYPNDVKLIWRNYPLSFHQGSDQTSAASECAHQQGKFWQYHDEIFATQQGGDRSDAGLKAMAVKLGLDTVKFNQCLDSGSAKAVVQSDLAAGTKAGVNGTPATIINGRLVSGAMPYEKFDAIVSSLIKTGNFPPDAPAAPPAPTGPVTFDDLAGRPFKGPADAPVTFVQFSDYHCPFCTRVEPTITQVMEAFPGKIKVVWRSNPLPFHTGADHTAAAAECAHEQGKFWQYHDELFAGQNVDHSDTGLDAIAKKIGLNDGKFKECLSSGRAKAVVDKDLAAGGKAGVRGTPATFINGVLLSGAQPFDAFKAAVEQALNKK